MVAGGGDSILASVPPLACCMGLEDQVEVSSLETVNVTGWKERLQAGGSLLEFVGGQILMLNSVEEVSWHGGDIFFGTEPLGVEQCGRTRTSCGEAMVQ